MKKDDVKEQVEKLTKELKKVCKKHDLPLICVVKNGDYVIDTGYGSIREIIDTLAEAITGFTIQSGLNIEIVLGSIVEKFTGEMGEDE